MEFWLWGGFVTFVLIMLALDLGVLNRKAHVVATREALIWAGFCVFLALLFNVFLYFAYERNWFDIATRGGTLSGKTAAMQFFTGWLIEQSLSLDNIFVIALIFQYFSVPRIHQHRTLFWGIIGALVMRMAMILAGAALIQRFTWTIYVFGILLLYTAVKMYRSQDEAVEPNRNPLVKLARKLYPVTDEFHGEKFFVRVNGRRAITPLFLVLLVIESTDLLFAVDSIPAIFAITKDPFIVFTSNVFAILNLRSLYFVLASMLEKFKYLKPSLVFVLAYVGVKMLVSHHYHIPTAFSLAVIIGILAVGIIASVISSKREMSRSA
ncbi:Inner membrane protein alx [Phycisphaerae bacterium RAS2]|nr:Inner membrane protein alx [Phycisphaerae bacterium RAS2]